VAVTVGCRIVHDWDDSNALQILRNVRAAIMLDVEMLVVATGRERTADEYADLLRAAGFRNSRVISTAGPTSIVESEAA
jgi:hypothetical protein